MYYICLNLHQIYIQFHIFNMDLCYTAPISFLLIILGECDEPIYHNGRYVDGR